MVPAMPDGDPGTTATGSQGVVEAPARMVA